VRRLRRYVGAPMSLSDYGRCPGCKQWGYLSTHRCAPLFLVWRPDDQETEEDARTFHARDAEEAAERWAEEDDQASADYAIVGGSSADLTVRGPDGALTRWTVTGEAVPEYHAREIEGVPK
jgi:hypothetical protein